MRVSLNTKQLEKQLFNITQYSFGFIEGTTRGKKAFLNNLGRGVIDSLAQYIDANARMNKEALHHVYEWYQTGSPSARLFNLTYTVSNLGLSVNSTFSQSKSVSNQSYEPFYNKARIMEKGVPIKINPTGNGVLAFENNGEMIYTKKGIDIQNPGGPEVAGAYEKVFDDFFGRYFTQAFLRASGLYDYIENPKIYKKDFASGSKQGRSQGIKTGYTWITNAKIGVDNA
jgi:hypothetical protein